MVTLPGKLAVVTSYFNPVGYQTLEQNCRRFSDGMQSQGVDLWTIEIAFGEDVFFLERSDRIVQIRTPDVMWQKERALNVLIDLLPKEYDKVAWVDADIIFENSKWAQDTARHLEETPVVQCFSSMQRLAKDGKTIDGEKISLAEAVRINHPQRRGHGSAHPGFAWAARRELLAKRNLYDAHILGANDILMAFAFLGWKHQPFLKENFNAPLFNHFMRWLACMAKEVRGSVGCIPGRINHLWHGSIPNRQYVERYDTLARHAFDPTHDIHIGEDGMWHWATQKPALHTQVHQYFIDRKDDGERS